MRLSIVIPAHNEERRIGPMLEAYLPFFTSRYGADVEILVVINGSTDRTDEVVNGYAARCPALRAIVEPTPIGKGGALMLGFREAKGDLVGFADADGSTPPEAFQDLVDKIGDAGAIIASRWAKGAQVSPRQPLDRRLASRFFNLMTRALFGLKLTDTQCGAKLMTRAAVEAILPHLGITQWAFDVDLLFQLRRAGCRIVEVPTVWSDVAGSKIQMSKASTEMMLALIRLRLIYSPFKWVVDFYNRFLGPLIHPVGTVRDYLLTHTLMLFIGAQFANFCNLMFQFMMLRMLGPAEYGVMAAVLGGVMVMATPLTALSNAVTHFASELMARNERVKVKALLAAVGRDMLWPILLVLAGTLVFQQELMESFKLDTAMPLYLGAGILVVTLLGAVPGGILGGLQAFEWVASVGNSWTVVRLLCGALIVLLGLGASGALAAHLAGMAVAAVLSFWVCLALLGREPVKPERPVVLYSYMSGFMATAFAYGVLLGADVLLAKRFFSPEEAGVFAKAATLARMVFFLPGPVTQAMFPKVTSTGGASHATRRTLIKSLVVVGLLVVAAVAVLVIFPNLILRLLAPPVHPGQVELLRGMALALAPLAFVSVIFSYELAQRRFGIMIPLYVCAAGYVLAVWRWHGALQDIVWALGVASTVALGLCLAFVMRGGRSRRADKGLTDGTEPVPPSGNTGDV